jgi:site-specific recombinase XerD
MTPKPLFGGKSPKALPWRPLPHMQEYLDDLAAGETTDAYIKSAKVGLSHYATFLRNEGVQHPDEIERHHILRFQAYLTTLISSQRGQPLSLAYRQQIMKYIRTWMYWCMELDYVTGNPWVRIRVGQQLKKPKPLDDDEIAQLFETHRSQAFSITPFSFHRRETILVLLYGWGLRIHELQSLTVTQLDMRLDFVTCRNKGGGEKVLPYATEMKEIVARWLGQRAKKAIPGEDALLIDHQGQPMRSAVIYKVVTELGARAGVAINPHRLRDSFGTKLLENDVPVERVMKMMGHTQRAQTLAYAKVMDHTLKSSHDAVMNPLLHRLVNEPIDKP